MQLLAPNTEPPGRVIGQYELLARLGSGGMGTVFKARHTQLNRTIALKILAPHRTHDPSAVDRFRREMQALGQLTHPHIARATDAGESGGFYYLAMEFVAGVDLGRVIRETLRLSVADACEVVRQTAAALAYISEHGMVHRDIKPSNLLLGRDGIVRVLDLGLARLGHSADSDGQLTETGMVMGTPDFIAPEQARGAREIDIRADIYSLGCTFYALLAGTPPFGGPEYDSVYKKFKAHNETPPPSIRLLRPEVPEDIDYIIEWMLEKDPLMRPRSPLDVIRELDGFCDGTDLRRLADEASVLPEAPTATLVELAPHGATPPDRVLRPDRRPLSSQSATVPNRARVRRRWRWAGAAVALVGVVSSGAVMRSVLPVAGERGPEDSPHPDNTKGVALVATERAVPKPPVDTPRTFRPGVWTDLLDRRPTELIWPKGLHNTWWEWKPERLLRIDGKDRALFQVADVDLPGYDLEVVVSQNPWVGGLGVFFRGRDQQRYSLVTADMVGLEPFVVLGKTFPSRFSRDLIHADRVRQQVVVEELVSEPIPVPKTDEHKLTLTVGPNGLEAMAWDGAPVGPRVYDSVVGTPNRQGASGSIGIFVQNCTVTVHSIRLRPK